MSWWKTIFLSSKTTDSLVDAAVKTGDAIWYTEEEKAIAQQDMREWYLKLLGSMSPFNVAMRLLAFIVGGIWATHLITSTLMYIAAVLLCGVDAEEVCRSAMAAEAINNQLTTHINEPFYMVMAFYFGAAGVNGAIRTFKAK